MKNICYKYSFTILDCYEQTSIEDVNINYKFADWEYCYAEYSDIKALTAEITVGISI